MTTQNHQKRFQYLIAVSLILSTPAMQMAFANQTNAPHRQAGTPLKPNADRTGAGLNVKALSKKIPSALSAVAENGEDLYDSAKAKNWALVESQLKTLKQAQQKLSTEVSQPKAELSVLHREMSLLTLATQKKDALATMHDANQVTLHAARLTAQFQPAEPSEVAILDYLGRELEMGIIQKDQAKLQNTSQEIRKTWRMLEPTLKAHGGATQAKTFDHLVTQIVAAKTLSEYKQLAPRELAEVDNLETVFHKTK
jgi:hypothetical protein